MRRTQAKSFERFYYERVGIGEGCGCAELIIGTHDRDTRARAPAHGRSLIGRFMRAARRFGKRLMQR